ncbi:SseB family protein [Aestuariirhabdus sp. Z084]|uniref:SseB family protein n=1 Tax=Aestuariirhabdus haliotis TaxID=2918751 RepID=UPI00201B4571|nr:SseB family protein [Aestuariirhabdus haliotis]MCL6416452.1 SseB family protein [Aestuariirhabdus haliotis]MCL6420442.1 SseB family protein [Aestuariirhabdus haliotis]
MTLLEALQAKQQGEERALDAILECLITTEVQLLSQSQNKEDPELLQLEIAPNTGALALFSGMELAQEMAAQLPFECEPLSVPGYWPLLELDDSINLVIDPGSPHNLVLPADVIRSLQPVIRSLLETDS